MKIRLTFAWLGLVCLSPVGAGIEAYDAYGNVTGNGVPTFSYDDAAGAPIKEYAYLAGAMYTASTGAVTSYHLDPAGSPVAATDATGTLLWREAYRPYGERLKVQDGGTNTLWFAGKVQDATTGLSYMGARYYDPAIGRFMAVDPVGFSDQNLHSFNRYGYANNNPYKFNDPDGRAADLIIDIGFIGYDLYKLATEPSWINAAALGGDVIGSATPFVTGVGAGIRTAAHADDAVDMLRGAAAAGDAARASGAVFKTTREAAAAAEKMGFRKVNERVHGQTVFTDGKKFITRDADGHQGGAWKVANSVAGLAKKETRTGTYSADLAKRVGD